MQRKLGTCYYPISPIRSSHLYTLASLSALSNWKADGAKTLASQIASKGYFAGEAAGLRLASREGPFLTFRIFQVLIPKTVGPDKLEKLPPQLAPSTEIHALKAKMARTMEEIRHKNSSLTVQDLKRLLFRCAATLISLAKVGRIVHFQHWDLNDVPQCEHELLHHLVALPIEVSTPSAISAGIEVWTWVIAEKPDVEVALMGEVLSAWSDTIKQEKGIFSTSLKCVLSSMVIRINF